MSEEGVRGVCGVGWGRVGGRVGVYVLGIVGLKEGCGGGWEGRWREEWGGWGRWWREMERL